MKSRNRSRFLEPRGYLVFGIPLRLSRSDGSEDRVFSELRCGPTAAVVPKIGGFRNPAAAQPQRWFRRWGGFGIPLRPSRSDGSEDRGGLELRCSPVAAAFPKIGGVGDWKSRYPRGDRNRLRFGLFSFLVGAAWPCDAPQHFLAEDQELLHHGDHRLRHQRLEGEPRRSLMALVR